MSPRIHGMRTYDDWKLATPPEYDELGPEPCECEGRGCPECDPEPEPEEEEWRHERDCHYVTSDGPAPCTCAAGLLWKKTQKKAPSRP